jgi:hypothetical protein
MFFITTKHVLFDIGPTGDGSPLGTTIARLRQPRLDVRPSIRTPEGSWSTPVDLNPAIGLDFTNQ